jgi:hypothetical protein
MTVEGFRHTYPAEGDPNAVRVETSLHSVSARGVALVAMDNPAAGAD